MEGANRFLRRAIYRGLQPKVHGGCGRERDGIPAHHANAIWTGSSRCKPSAWWERTIRWRLRDCRWQLEKSRFRSSLAGCTVTIHEHLDQDRVDPLWSARSRPLRGDREGAPNHAHPSPRRAVEKAGPWKPWKTTNRFPTVPTVPWKTRPPRGIPTFPPPRPLGPPPYEPKTANPLRQAEGARRTEQT